MEESKNWEMLARRKARLADYFNQMITCCPIGLATCYQDGFLLKVNPAAEILFGKGQQQLVGQNISEYFKLPENWHKMIVTDEPHLFKDGIEGYDLLINVMSDYGNIRDFVVAFLPK